MKVIANDGQGGVTEKTFPLTVKNVPPEFNSGIDTKLPKVKQRTDFAFDLTPFLKGYDPNIHTITISGNLDWMSVIDGQLVGNKAVSSILNYDFTVTISDGNDSISQPLILETVFVTPLTNKGDDSTKFSGDDFKDGIGNTGLELTDGFNDKGSKLSNAKDLETSSLSFIEEEIGFETNSIQLPIQEVAGIDLGKEQTAGIEDEVKEIRDDAKRSKDPI